MDTNFHSIYPEKRDDPNFIKSGKVVVGDNCWIGPGAFLLPGTKLGEGTTVAAGAVVMGRFPPRSVIAGNPGAVMMVVGEPQPYVTRP
jgi:acetyltransferase-like isoleucine patch superfamily enzyme